MKWRPLGDLCRAASGVNWKRSVYFSFNVMQCHMHWNVPHVLSVGLWVYYHVQKCGLEEKPAAPVPWCEFSHSSMLEPHVSVGVNNLLNVSQWGFGTSNARISFNKPAAKYSLRASVMSVRGFCVAFLLILRGHCCGAVKDLRPDVSDQELFWGADQYDFAIVLPAAGLECFWHFAHRGEHFYLNFMVIWPYGTSWLWPVTAKWSQNKTQNAYLPEKQF